MTEKRIGVFSQLLPPKPTWTATDVPDQTGKVVIVTGGNGGIGKETARVLLSKGAKVYIATRFKDKAEAAIEDLKIDTQKETVFHLHLNLADLDSIKATAEEFSNKEKVLHALYNNDSVSYAPTNRVTSQGYDLGFGCNVLGHFYLTKLLLPRLKAAVATSPIGTVRVVNVSSIVHYMAPSDGIRWSTLDVGEPALAARKTLGIARLYGQSRLGNILFSNELARKHGDDGIVSISLFPGAINADISGTTGSFFRRISKMVGALICFIVSGGNLEDLAEGHHPSAAASAAATREMREMRDHGIRAANAARNAGPEDVVAAADELLSEGQSASYLALTSLYAGTEPTANKYNGKYLAPWARPSLPHRKALKMDLARQLWAWCEEQVKDGDVKERPEEDVNDEDIREKDTKDTEIKEKEDVKDDSEETKNKDIEEVDAKSKDGDSKEKDIKREDVKDDDAKDEDAKGKDVQSENDKEKA